VSEQKPETKKKGCLGCSLPVAITIIVIALVLFIVGFLAGPLGQSFFKGINMPDWLKVPTPSVELPAEAIFHIGPLSVTNTILTAWITIIVLAVILIGLGMRSKLIPGRFQGMIESALEWVYNLCKDVAGEKTGPRLFPIIVTIFLFVLFNAWMGLIPGYGSLLANRPTLEVNSAAAIEEVNKEYESVYEFKLELPTIEPTVGDLVTNILAEEKKTPEVGMKLHEENIQIVIKEISNGEVVRVALTPQVPLLRGANTDINTPLAVALISFVFVTYMGLASGAGGFLKGFFNGERFTRGLGKLFTGKVKGAFGDIGYGLIDGFVGILELVSYIFRIFSFTFRLFGNMTGGEILVLMFLFLFPFVIVLPIYGLELLVGAVQALIFSGLTLVFATIAGQAHGEEHH